jgi:Flp pilus assembly pilin Flp
LAAGWIQAAYRTDAVRPQEQRACPPRLGPARFGREIPLPDARHANCCSAGVLPTRSARSPDLSRCSRGDAAVEYVVLLGTMAIPLVPVMVAFGAWLVATFENIRNLVVLPFP